MEHGLELEHDENVHTRPLACCPGIECFFSIEEALQYLVGDGCLR